MKKKKSEKDHNDWIDCSQRKKYQLYSKLHHNDLHFLYLFFTFFSFFLVNPSLIPFSSFVGSSCLLDLFYLSLILILKLIIQGSLLSFFSDGSFSSTTEFFSFGFLSLLLQTFSVSLGLLSFNIYKFLFLIITYLTNSLALPYNQYSKAHILLISISNSTSFCLPAFPFLIKSLTFALFISLNHHAFNFFFFRF